MMSNLSTHAPPKFSSHDWDGSKSNKFPGGKYHANHPEDVLDNLLINRQEEHSAFTKGKKHFDDRSRNTIEYTNRPQMRIFDQKYKKSTVFDVEEINKLIKIPKDTNEYNHNSKYNFETIGKSKMKALQSGIKKNGIYRNFYQSQTKSHNIIKGISNI